MKYYAIIFLTLTGLTGYGGGAESEEFQKGWVAGNKTLSPICLPIIWSSGDNFELIAENFHIKNPNDFKDNPGKYYGREITDFSGIKTDWPSHKYVNFSQDFNQCLKLNEGTIVSSEVIEYVLPDPKFNTPYTVRYIILSDVSTSLCANLAPSLSGECNQSYLVKIGDWEGGSRGFYWNYNIYGLFTMKDKKRYIFLLKRFINIEEAKKYLKHENRK